MTAIAERMLAIADWRSWVVFRRHAFVYFRNWKTAFLPPAFEPLVFFVALGIGLRGYVGEMSYGPVTIDYSTYVAPGLISYTCFTTPFFESLYSSYVRMFYQKTWDGILATQVELRHILWGEVLWAGCRGGMNATVVALVLGLIHATGVIHIEWWWLPVLPLIGTVAGWCFGAFGLIFTAIVPAIDHMNYPVFLIGVPLGLISNTYFPVPTDHPTVALLTGLNPVYHLSETFRSLLVLGHPSTHLVWLIVTVTVYGTIFVAYGYGRMERRVFGD